MDKYEYKACNVIEKYPELVYVVDHNVICINAHKELPVELRTAIDYLVNVHSYSHEYV